jgi:hypothetical protein
VRAILWRHRRAVDRAAVIEDIVADYATSICGRPVRRREVPPMTSAIELPGVIWSIDGDVMVELLVVDGERPRVVVHEIALLKPIKRQLRTRHLDVELAAWAV